MWQQCHGRLHFVPARNAPAPVFVSAVLPKHRMGPRSGGLPMNTPIDPGRAVPRSAAAGCKIAKRQASVQQLL